MNRYSTTLLVALGALASVACVVDEDASEGRAQLTTTDELRDLEPEIEAANCPIERQVVRLEENAPCPTVSNWEAEPLLGGAAGELGRYCVYDWAGGGSPTSAEVQAIANEPDVAAVAADCEVVFPQTSDAMHVGVGQDIEDLFHHAIGRPSATDLDLVNTEGSRADVVVAVIDSVPTPVPTDPRSEHGELMASIIEDITCPAGVSNCAVTTRRMLGLPRFGAGWEDPVRGGKYGSHLDLFEGITDAIKALRAANANLTSPPKLVINLSLGWNGEDFGDVDDPDTRPAVDALHAAIELAVCEGALVIAAAGNQGDDCGVGPLLPAAWEQYPAPDASRCAELGALSAPAAGGVYRPLLYSVGGTSHDGGAMPGTRLGARPRLAAMSDHALATDDSTAPTGTSVSSAVVAGAAALLWSYFPNRSPFKIMGTLYTSGAPLPALTTADYYEASAPNTDIHAVNVCAALDTLCGLQPLACPLPSPLACLGAPAPLTVDDLFTNVNALADVAAPDAVFNQTQSCTNACGETGLGFTAEGVSGSPCPPNFNPLLDPELDPTLPQPTQIGCPNCTLEISTATVHASIDPEYDGLPITDVLITVSGAAEPRYFRYGSLALSVGTITEIRLDPDLMPEDVSEAEISINFDNQLNPVVDPLLLNR